MAIWAAPLCLGDCDRHSTSPIPDAGRFIGKWVDLASLETTASPHCCFFDSTRPPPCPPDTLVLRADSTLAFTSLPDEPSTFAIRNDTLYRYRASNPANPERFAFTLAHDTLNFALAPLCVSRGFTARYRKASN